MVETEPELATVSGSGLGERPTYLNNWSRGISWPPPKGLCQMCVVDAPRKAAPAYRPGSVRYFAVARNFLAPDPEHARKDPGDSEYLPEEHRLDHAGGTQLTDQKGGETL